MKSLKAILIVCYGCISYGFAQTVGEFKVMPSSIEVSNEKNAFFIPSLATYNTSIFTSYTLQEKKPIVFKSPVHYTAFFCKMELETVQRLGIWIKVHAGDYDAYSGNGCTARY